MVAVAVAAVMAVREVTDGKLPSSLTFLFRSRIQSNSNTPSFSYSNYTSLSITFLEITQHFLYTTNTSIKGSEDILFPQ